MKCIIFAGGNGTRLWPLSRKSSPKQFEQIIGSKSTLQRAVERLQPDFSVEDCYVATSNNFVPLVHEQLSQIPVANIIGEPAMRDVGPAVGLLTAILAKISPHEPMVILWSDHMVREEVFFRTLLISAGKYVAENPNSIVFVAQKPRFASENLGWIEYGKVRQKAGKISLHDFIDFQYRPDKKTAKHYFNSGHHAWNLGYFVTTPSFLWAQYKEFAPNLYQDLGQIAQTWGTDEFTETLNRVYPKVEKISFDNAILEKLNPDHAKVIAENIGWSDVGAWEALKEALEESKEHTVSQGKVIIEDTTDSLVYNFTDQMLVTIDIDDMVVVNTKDVVMVCKKTSVPKIKKLVERLSGTELDHLT